MLEEISKEFVDDVKLVLTGVLPALPGVSSSSAGPSSSHQGLQDEMKDETSVNPAAPETVDQMKELQYQASKQGFVLNTHIHE